MLSTGEVINGYRIERLLGQGGMGVVYEAVQLSLQRHVAIKVLTANLSSDEEFRHRFRREAHLQAGFSHPNIVTVHDFGETDGGLYLVMQLIDGVTLKELLRYDEMPADRCLGLLEQSAGALDTAHRAGLVHRDIKPQNILVAAGDRAYLADFGLTRLATDSGLTKSGQFVGTVDYIAPEQIQGLPPTPAADVYSLAALLYECLTGRVPFEGSNELAVIYAHASRPPPRPSEVRPDLPRSIDAVIAKGMAKNTEERPTSALELIDAARTALGGMSPARPASRARLSGGQTTISPAEPTVPPAEPAEGERITLGPVDVDFEPGQEPPPAVTGPPRRRGGTWRAGLAIRAAAAVALVALASAAGVLVAGATSAHHRTGLRSASSALVTLRYSSPWIRVGGSSAPVRGITLTGPVSLREPGEALTVSAGLATLADPTLLPRSMRSQLTEPLSAAQRVKAGAIQGLLYRNLSLRTGSQHLVVLAVPVVGGAAIAFCSRSAPLTSTDNAACERVTSSLGLRTRKTMALAPRPPYARSISRAIQSLGTAQSSLLRSLSAAKQPSAQASALATFRPRCLSATRAFDRIVAGPQEAGSQLKINRSVGDLCSAYAEAESAARSGSRPRYDAARAAAGDAEKRLTSAVGSLRSIGYRL
jgi:hypothetical protein